MGISSVVLPSIAMIPIAPNGGKFLYTENIAKEKTNVPMVLFVC
jgi:hypothetical protein